MIACSSKKKGLKIAQGAHKPLDLDNYFVTLDSYFG